MQETDPHKIESLITRLSEVISEIFSLKEAHTPELPTTPSVEKPRLATASTPENEEILPAVNPLTPSYRNSQLRSDKAFVHLILEINIDPETAKNASLEVEP